MSKFFLTMAAVVVAMTSCLNSNDDEYNKIIAVQPGISLRNVAKVQNDLATDPANIAVRLGIYLAEAEKQGCVDDWSKMQEVSYGNNKYNLKNFLFGENTIITRPTVGNLYTIKYDESRAVADTYTARIGSFAIDTKGVALQNATADKAWTINFIDGPVKYYSTSLFGADFMMVAQSMPTMNVYYNGQNIVVEFRNFAGYIASKDSTKESDLQSAWSGRFNIVIANPTTAAAPADLSYTTLYDMKATFSVSGSADGSVYASLNGTTDPTSTATMRYSVDSMTPLVYKPALAYLKIFAGIEDISASAADLSTAFPSPMVKYTWSDTSVIVSYNGNFYTANN